MTTTATVGVAFSAGSVAKRILLFAINFFVLVLGATCSILCLYQVKLMPETYDLVLESLAEANLTAAPPAVLTTSSSTTPRSRPRVTDAEMELRDLPIQAFTTTSIGGESWLSPAQKQKIAELFQKEFGFPASDETLEKLYKSIDPAAFQTSSTNTPSSTPPSSTPSVTPDPTTKSLKLKPTRSTTTPSQPVSISPPSTSESKSEVIPSSTVELPFTSTLTTSSMIWTSTKTSTVSPTAASTPFLSTTLSSVQNFDPKTDPSSTTTSLHSSPVMPLEPHLTPPSDDITIRSSTQTSFPTGIPTDWLTFSTTSVPLSVSSSPTDDPKSIPSLPNEVSTTWITSPPTTTTAVSSSSITRASSSPDPTPTTTTSSPPSGPAPVENASTRSPLSTTPKPSIISTTATTRSIVNSTPPASTTKSPLGFLDLSNASSVLDLFFRQRRSASKGPAGHTTTTPIPPLTVDNIPPYFEQVFFMVQTSLYVCTAAGLLVFFASLVGICGGIFRVDGCLKFSVAAVIVVIVAEMATIGFIFVAHDKASNRNKNRNFEQNLQLLCDVASFCINPVMLVMIGSFLCVSVILQIASITLSCNLMDNRSSSSDPEKRWRKMMRSGGRSDMQFMAGGSNMGNSPMMPMSCYNGGGPMPYHNPSMMMMPGNMPMNYYPAQPIIAGQRPIINIIS